MCYIRGMRWILVFLLVAASCPALAQQTLLQAGPMLGYSEMREVLLWLQTKQPARVRFEYYELATPAVRMRSAEVSTSEAQAHIARVVVPVLPGRKYGYDAYINDKKLSFAYATTFQSIPDWRYKSAPADFQFAIGSCAYINDTPYDRKEATPYGSGYEIFERIAEQKPDFMVWGGDNVYLREADCGSRTGILYRYAHARALPQLQQLLATTHHYATWDDHDYGPNDADRSYAKKQIAKEAFDLYWGNPYFNVQGLGGITNQFQWSDCDFFVLDDRWHKSPNDRRTGQREMFGQAQLQWLIDALKYSNASFKFVVTGGLILHPGAFGERMATYPDERAQLLKALRDEKIPGVIFLTGDVHQTELSVLKEDMPWPVYDLTVSPLTSGVNTRASSNSLAVPGTFLAEHNFGMLRVSGPADNRVLTIRILGRDGQVRWQRDITAKELGAK